MTVHTSVRQWPGEGLTRVPYWIYSDPDLYTQEQERIFRGNTWNFLCLEAELPRPNTFRTSNLGDMPVVVTRDADGKLHAFENRCAHRGALLCLTAHGERKEFACVYHNWTYDLAGNLTGVAFRRGIAGKGGMPPDATPERHAPRQAGQIEVAEAELMQPMAERFDRCLGQAEVGPDVEVRDDRGFLVDRDDPAAPCLGRGVDRSLPAAERDRARVGPDRAGQDLDQRALARAVGTHQRMHLARTDGEGGRLQRDNGPVGLGDAARLEQEIGGGEGHRPWSSVSSVRGETEVSIPANWNRHAPRTGWSDTQAYTA